MPDKLEEGGKAYHTVSVDDKAFNIMEGVESKESIDISSMGGAFKSFKKRWNDPDTRKHYDMQRGLLESKYLTKPAAFTGFIEESAEMRKDVISAAKETGVDPNFLYNVTMQEGMAYKMSMLQKASSTQKMADMNLGSIKEDDKIKIYESGRYMDTYSGIGLDALFSDQELAVNRGYLESPIEGKNRMEVWNEKGMKTESGGITSKDAWRGVGAMIRLNKDYITSQFKKRGLDFSELSQDDQNFWIYASYNAGAGDTAKKLLDVYGVDPMQNKDLRRTVQKQKDRGFVEDKMGVAFWMHNVGRVVGGSRTTNIFNPFGPSKSNVPASTE